MKAIWSQYCLELSFLLLDAYIIVLLVVVVTQLQQKQQCFVYALQKADPHSVMSA